MMLDRARLIGDAIERMGIARRSWLGAIVVSQSLPQTVYVPILREMREWALENVELGIDWRLEEGQTLKLRSRSRGVDFLEFSGRVCNVCIDIGFIEK